MRKTLTIRDSHEPVSIPGADGSSNLTRHPSPISWSLFINMLLI